LYYINLIEICCAVGLFGDNVECALTGVIYPLRAKMRSDKKCTQTKCVDSHRKEFWLGLILSAAIFLLGFMFMSLSGKDELSFLMAIGIVINFCIIGKAFYLLLELTELGTEAEKSNR
tara:strand:- start:526 stop:879 length:354 start_codon:yes stop_codon:yes gene_type:complete